jgi:molybdate transport system substrate-binding protein
MRGALALLTLMGVALVGCSASGAEASARNASASTSGGVATADLTIYGAASLAGALDAAKGVYEGANPGSTLTISTDSSAALETQIEQGAPADVFLAADTTNPKKLVNGGFAAGDAVAFARNELMVIVPKGDPGDISTPADLAREGVRIVAAGDGVPITTYASRLVRNLAKVPGYPADFEAAYARNVVSKEDNVNAVVAKVGLGEGDAAIVYATDAKASREVETVTIPDGANVPATYAGVVVKASRHPDAARAFLDWLVGPTGQRVLQQFGFLPNPT